MDARIIVKVQRGSFDAQAEGAALLWGLSGIGALVTFTGLCRDEEGRLAALEIEHYPGMAEAEISRAATDAASRFGLKAALAVHRYGMILPGEPIVLVITAAGHRAEAFDAAKFVMDYLKSAAPFWKKQHLIETGPGGWVEARPEDEAAAARWRGEGGSGGERG